MEPFSDVESNKNPPKRVFFKSQKITSSQLVWQQEQEQQQLV